MRLRSRLTHRHPLPTTFLECHQWLHVAECERMRVDRNGSVLAVLSVALPAAVCDRQSLAALADYLQCRLRQTDSFGWRTDGRLGLLLPDTDHEGAEVVADALVGYFGEHAAEAVFEIDTYPDRDERGDRGLKQRGPVVVDDPVGAGVNAGMQERVFFRAMPWWKRSIDIAGASLGLLVTGPFLATAACAVMATSRGGAFYRQEREGLGGKRFKILKLRTMVADADSQKASLRQHSVQDGPAFKMYGDPRVTTVGRILRATSLDELPQLINVLRGEMSLVGPRPLPVDESLACSRWQRRRLQVTPGITCTWQVIGRNTVTFDEWMRMDLRYAQRRSLARDLWLIACTGPSILLSRGPR